MPRSERKFARARIERRKTKIFSPSGGQGSSPDSPFFSVDSMQQRRSKDQFTKHTKVDQSNASDQMRAKLIKRNRPSELDRANPSEVDQANATEQMQAKLTE
jgi:hypothetical protein